MLSWHAGLLSFFPRLCQWFHSRAQARPTPWLHSGAQWSDQKIVLPVPLKPLPFWQLQEARRYPYQFCERGQVCPHCQVNLAIAWNDMPTHLPGFPSNFDTQGEPPYPLAYLLSLNIHLQKQCRGEYSPAPHLYLVVAQARIPQWCLWVSLCNWVLYRPHLR